MWAPTTRLVTGGATVLTLIAFLNEPLMAPIVSTWQGIPWWVGLLVVVPLVLYAVVRASYGEFLGVDRERAKLRAQNDALEVDLREARAYQEGKVPEGAARLIEQLKSENQQLRDQPGDEALKERALRLSSELFGFAQERDETAPPEAPLQWSGGLWDTIKENVTDPRTQERTNHDNETRRQYVESYGGRVGALFDALERRGWLDAEERKALEDRPGNEFTSPMPSIRQIAQRLAAFGKRL